jgi:hypothetical protein
MRFVTEVEQSISYDFNSYFGAVNKEEILVS